MSENKDFDSIMREITSGLTGDSATDIKYLQEKSDEYKDHELGKEIIRACGRLMYEILPDNKKEELSRAINKDFMGTDAVIDEVRFNIYKKDYNTALKLIEGLVNKVEELNAFQDDQVSEYHVFNEFFEEILYRHIYNPSKDLRNATIPYVEIYSLYGSLLVELKRIEDARVALKKGLHWNPINFTMTSEYIETFKMSGDMDTYFNETLKAFKIAFRPNSVARCFRNLGYYFVEKELYSEAIACYLMSTNYEKSKQVQSELYYISEKTGGKLKEPSLEDFKSYSQKYGFPLGADKDILAIAYTYGSHFAENNVYNGARYCFEILYDLTDDDDIKKIESLPNEDE